MNTRIKNIVLTTFLLGIFLNIEVIRAANNDCSTALLLVPGCTAYTFSTSGTSSPREIPSGGSGCSVGAFDAKWGYFIATETSTTINYINGSSKDATLHVFSGACGSLVQEGCADANGNGGNESVTITTTIGITYRVRVQRIGSDNTMSGTINVPQTLTNDNCSSATSLVVDAACVNGGTCNSTVEGGESNSCGGTFTQSVWYSFVATSTNHTIHVDQVAGSCYFNSAIWSGTCLPTTNLTCEDAAFGNLNQNHSLAGLTISNTYYIQISYDAGGCGDDASFCVDVITGTSTDVGSCLCNDEAVFTMGTCHTSTLSGASNCYGTIGCQSGANSDAAFIIVPTTTTLFINVDNVGTGFGNVEVVLVDNDDCTNAAFIASSCGATPFAWSQTVTAGKRYAFLISSSNGANGATTQFGVCIGDGSACVVTGCGYIPAPPGDAYGIHSPDALGGTVTSNQLSATAGTGGTSGLVYANGGEVGTSVAISGYPTITAQNINCLNSNIDFSTTGTNPTWPVGALGTNANDGDAAPLPTAIATINNNQYTATLGRRNISLTADVIVCGGGAMTSILTEGFEGGTFPPTGWSQYFLPDNVSSLAWARTTSSPKCGSAEASHPWANPDLIDEALETPAMDFSTYNNCQLDFQVYMNGNWGDQLFVEVSTDGGGLGGTWTQLAQYINTGGAFTGWTNKVISLSAYDCTSNIKVRFRNYQPSNNNWTLIDCIIFQGNVGSSGTSTSTYTDFVNIQMAKPTASLPTGNTPICAGAAGNYVSPDAGTPGYSYVWATSTNGTQAAAVIATPTASSTDITFSNVSGGDLTYTVYLDVTSECCGPLVQVSKVVTVNSLPIPLTTAVVNAAPSVCTGGSATLQVSSPNALYNYEWYTAATGGTPVATGSSYTVTAPAGATSYYVEAVTANGCRNTARTLVTLTGTDTPPTVPNPGAGCASGIYTATVSSPVSGATYNWYSDAGLTTLLQGATTISYGINATASPTLVYTTVTEPGCGVSSSTTVTVTFGAPPASVTWDGTTSTDWFTATNWSPNCVPTRDVNVVIPTGATRNCEIRESLGGIAECKNLTMDASGATLTLAESKSVLEVYGNWVNNNSTAAFDATTNSGWVRFTASVAQSIGGSQITAFHSLVINNTSATGVTLNKTITVAGTVSFTDGNLYTNAVNIIIINDNATSSGGSANSFVDGPIKKIGNEAFIFPTGDGTKWARIAITAPTLNTTEYTAQYYLANPNGAGYTTTSMGPNLTALGAGNVSIMEYWNLAQGVNNDDVQIKLYWENSVFSGITDCDGIPDDLRIAHWSAGQWEADVNSVNLNGFCPTVGWIQTGTKQLTYSPFTFASKSTAINPLPIELLYFDAKYNGETHEVDLDWATNSETNNDYFTVEKTRKATSLDYNLVVNVPGAGNSNKLLYYEEVDEEPWNGLTYYRLKQTDYDGSYSYSNLVAVDILKNLKFSIFPNPAYDYVEVVFGTATKNTVFVMTPEYNAEIKIYDTDGRVAYTKKFDGTFYKFKINIADFNLGMYVITLSANNELYTAKFVKE